MRKPGVYLYLFLIWIIPFMVRDIVDFGIDMPILSIYLIPFGVCSIAAAVLNYIEKGKNFWKRRNFIFRSIILLSSYSLIIVTSQALTVILENIGCVNYVGDVFGTILMFYWPSIVLFWLIGFPMSLFLEHRRRKIKGVRGVVE
ncbi:MAG: hypothetical protein ACYTFX_12095 [Planctomycetota bacterium]|jgi:hypothetical protein